MKTIVRPARKTRRISSVEFWRFVFTVMVSLYHFELFFMKKSLFPSGSGAVEFFFVLAGFLLGLSAEKRHLARGGLPAEPKAAADRALDFAKNKLKAIVPIVLCWLVIHLFVAPGLEGFKGKLEFLMNAEWEVLLLVGTPFGFNGGFAPNIPLWFLTSLIVAGYVYTYLMERHYDRMRFLAPVIGVLGVTLFALKTTTVLESLVPALSAMTKGQKLPDHVRSVAAEGIAHIKLIDATPIGINIRSTVATYAGVHDELRKLYARTAQAKQAGYKAGDFSYNTGALRCPVCDGTGSISLDVQFLPDVDIPCPECRGSRYTKAAYTVGYTNKAGQTRSLPELMAMDVNTAADFCRDMKNVYPRLKVLQSLGLGYLTLGEETPGLSGGEAQRLKLAWEMGRGQADAVFVFDEPTIGLHPLDVKTLLGVFETLIASGATVVVIEHDLDVIRSADYLIDMGPGGGEEGGRVVFCGTPEAMKACPESVTGRYL